MPNPLVVNGVTYQYPVLGDENWGPDASNWASAMTTGTLQKAGGAFTLGAEVDFGSAYGVKTPYVKYRALSSAPTSPVDGQAYYDSTLKQFRVYENGVWNNLSQTANVYNVKYYGAVGDGATDDTAAIQAAINAAGSGIVFFPQATYNHTGLTFAVGCTLLGAGWTTILNNTSAVNHSISNSVTGASTGGFHIQDLKLTHSGGGTAVDGIHFNQVQNHLVIERVYIASAPRDGISITSGTTSDHFSLYPKILYCLVEAPTRHGIYINGTANSGTLIGGRIDGGTGAYNLNFDDTVTGSPGGNPNAWSVMGVDLPGGSPAAGLRDNGFNNRYFGLRFEANTVDILLDTASGGAHFYGTYYSTIGAITDNSAASPVFFDKIRTKGLNSLLIKGQFSNSSALGASGMLKLNGNTLTGTSQFSIDASTFTGTSAATSAIASFVSGSTTAAAAFTCAVRYQYFADTIAKGSGSTITRDIAYFSNGAPAQGSTGNAILADGISFTGSYGINLGSSNKNLLTGPTAIGGTSTNDSAAAGFVGEYLTQSRLRSAATSATTGTTLNVTATALSLTAGDWDVDGVVGFNPAGSTSITFLVTGIATTSATLSGTDTIAVQDATGQIRTQLSEPATVSSSDVTISLPTVRVSVSSTTSYFLVAQATFSVSTLTVYGSIRARRVR